MRYMPVLIAGLLAMPFALAAPIATAGKLTPSDCSVEPVFEQLKAQPELLKLGRDLFYDPILSGNREVACATCHHPELGTGDGLALGLGDGGIGLGPKRRVDPANVPEQRIPRNAQALFNLGYSEFTVMFHDGRVEQLPDGRILTPLGNRDGGGLLPVLTAQASFPVLSPDEMAGHYSENDVAQAVRRGLLIGPDGAHDLLAKRVLAIPGYRSRMSVPEVEAAGFEAVARALAAFMAHEWRADESAYDRLICEGTPLTARAEAGRKLFYGKAGCSDCHSGRFQTDHGFHSIAMPQIGPGKAERFETHARDTGRMRVTGRSEDAYRFRTPSLRNIALTAPYGHAGAYSDLKEVIRHHLNPVAALDAYKQASVRLPELRTQKDFQILESPVEVAAIRGTNDLQTVKLSEPEVDDLIAFLHALTDLRGIEGRLGVPERVPSGLPVPQP